MKTQTINPTLHDNTHANNSAATGNVPVSQVFKLGLDVDLRNVVVAVQFERGVIAPAQKFTRAQLIDWVRAKVAVGNRVHTV